MPLAAALAHWTHAVRELSLHSPTQLSHHTVCTAQPHAWAHTFCKTQWLFLTQTCWNCITPTECLSLNKKSHFISFINHSAQVWSIQIAYSLVLSQLLHLHFDSVFQPRSWSNEQAMIWHIKNRNRCSCVLCSSSPPPRGQPGRAPSNACGMFAHRARLCLVT